MVVAQPSPLKVIAPNPYCRTIVCPQIGQVSFSGASSLIEIVMLLDSWHLEQRYSYEGIRTVGRFRLLFLFLRWLVVFGRHSLGDLRLWVGSRLLVRYL